jgi:GntR family transcriptional regulator, transcriptional repressor for pyruvate dehydrogenase complex
MPLTRVSRRSVPDEVFDQVLGEVVSGALGPGESLPSERRLAEVLGVSRPAVREALQRMAQTRLLEVRHGGATTVRDFRRYAGLDLLPALLVRGGSVDVAVVRSVVEARLLIGPGVAALAAGRRDDRVVAGLTSTIATYAESDDPVDRQRLTLAYWDLVVDAADSITFRLLFNSLRAAYEPALPVLAAVLDAGESERPYRLLTAAIDGGDPDTARAAAEHVLRPSTDALLTALERLDQVAGLHAPRENP